MYRVGVEAHHPAAGRHPAGQQVKNPAWPAPQVDRPLPRPQTDPIKQRSAVGRQFISLALESRALPGAAAERVDGIGVLAAWRIRCRRPEGSSHLITFLFAELTSSALIPATPAPRRSRPASSVWQRAR
jgi:hypothetical protein